MIIITKTSGNMVSGIIIAWVISTRGRWSVIFCKHKLLFTNNIILSLIIPYTSFDWVKVLLPWKICLNIFLVLKSKQIKKIAHFFIILTKIKFVYTFKNINFLKTIPPFQLKQIECFHD